MSHDYSENILVQENTGKLPQEELGWEIEYAYNSEQLGKNGTFGYAMIRDGIPVTVKKVEGKAEFNYKKMGCKPRFYCKICNYAEVDRTNFERTHIKL